MGVTSIGEARRQIARLAQIRQEWRTAMNDLVRAYDEEFTDPPITLRTHRSGWRVTLRWRRRGRGSRAGGQSVFNLTSAQGRHVIEHLPPPAQRRLFAYDRRALAMNLNASIAASTDGWLRRYVAAVETLEAWQQEFGL